MYSTGIEKKQICKQGYHFVGNDQFSGGFFGSRRSKMFPTGFIGVLDWGPKSYFWGFDKK